MSANRIFENIVIAGLEKCVEKLSEISAGRWSLADVKVSRGALSEISLDRSLPQGGGEAVYFEVSGSRPFAAMVIFQPADIEVISKCFLGLALPRMAEIDQAGELLLSELGNVIVNAVIGSLSNALKRSFIPSGPRSLKGERQVLLKSLAAVLDKKQKHSLISIMVNLQCGHGVTRAEVVSIIPGKLEEEL